MVLICIFFFFKFIYSFKEREKERERERVGEGQIERRKERIPSRLHTVSEEPDARLELVSCDIMT